MIRTTVPRLGAGLAVIALVSCLPGDTRPGLTEYNVDANGLALKGYSPVSYVADGRAELGSSAHALQHRGVTYHLVSDEQMAAFRQSPDRFEPAFGGWCAYGISLGIRWEPDPASFEIIDGRLFLFSRSGEADARELWDRETDHPALIARADH